jgi:hypothetical protein
LTWYRTREDDGNAGATSVTLATATLGTWSTGGFKEKDSTHYPGWYELGIPDNVLASAATWATMTLKGAANMAPCIVNIFLVAVDFNDGTRFGMTGLPNGPMTIKKNAGETVPVAMFSSSTRQMQSGLTVSCTISQDGGMPAATSNAVTEVAGGEYKVVLTTTETNCNSIFLKFTASGADDLPMLFYTQP